MRPPPSASPLLPSVSPDRLELLPSECQCAYRRASLSECALANEDETSESESTLAQLPVPTGRTCQWRLNHPPSGAPHWQPEPPVPVAAAHTGAA